MSDENANGARRVDDQLIRVKMMPFELAPEFLPLKDSPVAEFETCDTIAPSPVEAQAIADAHPETQGA